MAKNLTETNQTVAGGSGGKGPNPKFILTLIIIIISLLLIIVSETFSSGAPSDKKTKDEE